MPPTPTRRSGPRPTELARQAREGLAERLATPRADAGLHRGATTATAWNSSSRLIEKMKYPGYFLIVADFIKWAKAQGIPVGPGRGSGAGSLVAYATTITDVDPLRFSLLFERFLNPDRVSMPDFDIDFCQDRRDEVIRYVQQKYGRDQVAQIITFGTLQARAVLRDVGRVLQMPYGQVDRLCKMVPQNPANPVTLAKAIEGEPRFAEEAEKEPIVQTLIDMCAEARRPLPPRLHACRRHRHRRPAAVRAGADVPRSALGHAGHPVQHEICRAGRAGEIRLPRPEDADRARPRGEADRAGAASTSIWRASRSTIQKTYAMLSRGEVVGVFQVESAGMRKALIGMKPDRIEDIIALVALYRPGPMENIPTYNARKHRRGGDRLDPSQDRSPGRRDARRHRLPGTGDADRAGAGRLFARRSRSAAPRHGQEDPRRDGPAARALRLGRRRARRRQAAGRFHLRPPGQVRRLRLQQEPCRGLRDRLLPDRLSEGALPGRVPRRIDDARHVEHRQARRLPPGRDAARHRGRAAIRDDVASATSRSAKTASSIRWRRSRALATRRSSTSSKCEGKSRSPTSRISASASIRGSSASASSKA